MDSVVEYGRRGAIAKALVGSGSGGGGVDDILRRLGNVETGVSELRSEVSALSATVSYLATATSVSDVRTEIAGVRSEVAAISAVIPHLATKADLVDVKTELKTAIAAVETKMESKETAMIKWIIATVLTAAGLAFTIAKLVH